MATSAPVVAAPVPPEEPARLEALHAYRILDTPPEPALDDLTTLAATITGAPISLISLIDGTRQWFKSRVGMAQAETPRDEAFCAHTILGKDLLIVPDASADPRFATNRYVTGDPLIRFYAGVPLVTADGHALGTLCVLDRAPRQLTPEQIRALRVLARYAMSELELRKANRDLASRIESHEAELARANSALRGHVAERAAARQALVESDLQLRLTLEATNIGVWETDLATARTAFNERVREIFGLPAGRFVVSLEEIRAAVHPDDVARVEQALQAALRDGGQYKIEHRIRRPDGSVRWTLVRAQVEHNAGQRAVRLRGVTLDITELRQAEQERRDEAQRSEQQLRQLADRMQALSRRLVEAQEQEQRQISAELHDRIGQNLTALALNLDMMSQALPGEAPALAERLRDSKLLLRAGIESVRGLMSDLRPPALDDYGLVAALKAHVGRVRARTGLSVEITGVDSIPRQPAAVELALFRIVQEALHNVVKHARARSVRIEVDHPDSLMQISVSDDGRGFDPAAVPPGHWGLLLMRERAETVGGTLTIDSRPGGGTRISASVPAT